MVLIKFVFSFLASAVVFMYIFYMVLSTLERCPKCGSKEIIEHDTDPKRGIRWRHCTKCECEF